MLRFGRRTDFKLQLIEQLTSTKQGNDDVRDFQRDIETLAVRFPDVTSDAFDREGARPGTKFLAENGEVRITARSVADDNQWMAIMVEARLHRMVTNMGNTLEDPYMNPMKKGIQIHQKTNPMIRRSSKLTRSSLKPKTEFYSPKKNFSA
ncbi:hypothetical protein B0H19DRAFT_1140565 [Mycena capillaripes]|nr:hypothetical protein B0H19DRAFT_1140565 [Mycena capillaripes]